MRHEIEEMRAYRVDVGTVHDLKNPFASPMLLANRSDLFQLLFYASNDLKRLTKKHKRFETEHSRELGKQ